MHRSSAVKAFIYDKQGRILLQLRDNKPDILEPNRWGFFGGMVEAGETLEEALARELLEELGNHVGCIETELFRTEENTYGTQNIIFLVRCTELDENFCLTEGQSFGWFTLDELVALPLCSLLSKQMSIFLHIMDKIDCGIEVRLEQALLDYCRLRKKNDRVFYAKETPATLDRQSIMLMKELATYRGLPVFRVCLHEDDSEEIHEMLMVHTEPTLVGPLKQNKTSLSYHMLDGVAEIALLDDSGTVSRRMRLASSDNNHAHSVRLRANIFRSMQTVSPYAIFLEIASGPFEDNDTIWLK
jgi:8-oxo-dGTP diphosphatase